MKSQVSALLHVTRGICKDILAVYPGMQVDLDRDVERIALYSEKRGLGLFTLDLPHLSSLLLKGLDSGRLSLEGPLSQRVSKRIQVPRLYSGLWLRVFDEDASLKADVDVNALFFLRSVLELGKKLEVGCSFDRTQAVVRSYHDIENSLRHPTLAWDDDELCREHTSFEHLALNQCVSPVGGLPLFRRLCENDRLRGASGYDLHQDGRDAFGHTDCSGAGSTEARRDKRYLDQVQRVADLILGSFEEFCPIFYSTYLAITNQGIGFRHGSGAVADRRKNWEKSQFLTWPHKLEKTFPFAKCGTVVPSEVGRPLNHEVASRLIAVPKTSKGPRLIAAEPTSHQWCQQLVLKFLFDQCDLLFRGSFIDFKDQEKSGVMVLTASLDRKLATVDLSDASDRLSCWTVERMFRSNKPLLLALHAARTRYLRDEISEGGSSFIKLKKFASQGTATTFPVMSLVMLFIALGACVEGEITWAKIWKLRHQVRVFGDDIILPTRGYTRLIRIMELLQLKVNVAKSYNDGHFRESCGVDGYRGYDVTPVRPKTIVADSPASCQAVVDTSNNLFNKGLWYASTACLELLPLRLRRRLQVLARNEDGPLSITSFAGGDESHLTRRWNDRLHRYEVRVWSLSNRTRTIPRDGLSGLLDFFASKHNSEQPRIVSEYRDPRKASLGLRWEPSRRAVRSDFGGSRPWIDNPRSFSRTLR